jgi:hypothetical protein
MVERGVIRNRAFAQQIKDFSGLRFDKITPTDIDGFMDFGDRLFVLIEGKHAGSILQTGQRLALERLVDACHCPPRRVAVCLIVDHFDAATADVDYAGCTVRTMRWNGKWVPPMQKGILLRQAVERLKGYSENMQRARLRVVGGAA